MPVATRPKTEIDLHALRQRYLDRQELGSPREMAEAAIGELSKKDLEEIGLAYLTDFFKDGIHEQRHKVQRGLKVPSSSRMNAAKLAHDILAQRENVGRDPDDWKWFGDCTLADITRSADLYREHAMANLDKAVQREQLAEMMQKRAVQLVRELTDMDLLEAMTLP